LLLKTEKTEKLVMATARVLKCLYLMGEFVKGCGSPMYRRGIIQQLIILLHWIHHNMPMWDMMKHNLSVYNEENGEVSFSILSRCVVGDTKKHEIDHLRAMYRTMNIYMECKQEIADDINSRSIRSTTSSHYNVKEDSDEVNETAAFFRSTIRKIQNKQFKMYNSKCYPSSNDGQQHSTEGHVNKIYKRRVWKKWMQAEVDEVVADTKTRWTSSYQHIWPEAHDDSDIEESDGSDDEVDLASALVPPAFDKSQADGVSKDKRVPSTPSPGIRFVAKKTPEWSPNEAKLGFADDFKEGKDFFVERILQRRLKPRLHKKVGRVYVRKDCQYLIRWYDLPPSEDSWEPYENIRDNNLITAYEEDHGSVGLQFN
jgi:hypothetical protein